MWKQQNNFQNSRSQNLKVTTAALFSTFNFRHNFITVAHYSLATESPLPSTYCGLLPPYHLCIFRSCVPCTAKVKQSWLSFQMPLPPSTSMFVPVRNLPSSLAKNNAVLATSTGSVSLPSGTTETNCSLFSGVSATPTKLSNRPVPESSGARELTRIWSGPYSAARPFVACADH